MCEKLLETSGLTAGYEGENVIYDVNIVVRKGEVVGIIGGNGTGKSTILKSILGETKIDRGSIKLFDREVAYMPTHKRIQLGIGVVPQIGSAFASLTVHENLLAGGFSLSVDESRRREEDLFGWLPFLGEAKTRLVGDLSTGERQLVGIARALMIRPRLLLADEPAAGLSADWALKVRRLLRSIAKEDSVGVAIVEHRVDELVKICERFYGVRGGRVVVEGSGGDSIDENTLVSVYGNMRLS